MLYLERGALNSNWEGTCTLALICEPRCDSPTPAAPGRLLVFDSPAPRVLVDNIPAPVSLAYDEGAKILYILDLTGRIQRLQLD